MSFQVRRLTQDRPERRFPWHKIVGVALLLRRPFSWWFGHWKKRHEEKVRQEQRMNLLKRIALIVLVIFCTVVLLAGTASALVKLKVLSLSSIAGVAGTDLPVDQYGHTNILLLGSGDESHDGVDLTDTMMIASIDGKNSKSVAMLSLPRDLYLLNTNSMGRGRINTMYRDYKIQIMREKKLAEPQASAIALRELADELSRLLEVQIHHVVKVDFIGFVQAVDAIGGFDIEVPEDLVDTEYPGPNYSYVTFTVPAGLQHFDGETALKYARSRHSTSDFSRSHRQQQIISAMGEKMKSEGILTRPDRVLSLLNIMNEHVEMTLSSRELIALAELGKEVDRSQILNMQLNDQAGLYGSYTLPGGFLYAPPRDQFGGASVLLPVSIPENPVTWKQVQSLVSLFLHARTPYLSKQPIDVLNGGAPPGSSRRLANEFIRYGFEIGEIANAENRDMETSLIRASEPLKEQGAFFAGLLQMPLEILPHQPGVTGTGSVSILLGKDYAYTPIQNLLKPLDTPQ
jgi:polyisoprenyl-teichoic acid--peptidoglycan teichoic acid transferase